MSEGFDILENDNCKSIHKQWREMRPKKGSLRALDGLTL
jgi:hypothetical protein